MSNKVLMSLCFIFNENKILLGLKKRGLGVGFYNGYGGKKHLDETMEECCKREVLEESGLICNTITKSAQIDVVFSGKSTETSSNTVCEIHAYKCYDYEGEPLDTGEMSPHWFGMNNIPYHQMWEDDSIWLNLFLKEHHLRGTFIYDTEGNNLLSWALTSQDYK